MIGNMNDGSLTAVPIHLRRTFFINHVSKMDGKTYEGQFTCRKMSFKMLGQLGVKKAQLNGGFYFDPSKPGQGIDEETDWINTMIATLSLAILQAPSWFNMDELFDVELIGKVYKEIAEFENNFFRSTGQATANVQSSPANSTSPSAQTGVAGSVKAVDGGQVSSALDP